MRSEENPVTTILWHQNIPDLFAAWQDDDDLATIDQEASGYRYIDLANTALSAAYPGAEVECRAEPHMVGYSPGPTVECGPMGDLAPPVEIDVVQDILAQVYMDLGWVVREEPA